MAGPCVVSATGCLGSPASCCSGRRCSTPPTTSGQRRSPEPPPKATRLDTLRPTKNSDHVAEHWSLISGRKSYQVLLWPDLLPECFHVSALIDTLCFDNLRFVPVASPAYCRAGQVGPRNEVGIRILLAPNTSPLRRGETMTRLEAPSATCTHFADIHA